VSGFAAKEQGWEMVMGLLVHADFADFADLKDKKIRSEKRQGGLATGYAKTLKRL